MDHNDTKLLFENWNKFVEGLQQIDEGPPRFVRPTRTRTAKRKSAKGSAAAVDDAAAATATTKVTGPTGRTKPSKTKIPSRFEKFKPGDVFKIDKNNELVTVSSRGSAHLDNAAQAALEAVEGLAQRGAKAADELQSLSKADDIEIDTLLNRIRTAKFHGLANSIRNHPKVTAAILIGVAGVGAQKKLRQYYDENLRLIKDVEIIPYMISQETLRLAQAKRQYENDNNNQEAFKAMKDSRDRILGLAGDVDQMKDLHKKMLLNAQKLILAAERKIKQELKVPTSPEDLPDPPTDVELTDSDIDNVAFEMGLDPERIAPREPDEVPYRTGRRLEEPAKKKPKIKVRSQNARRKRNRKRFGGAF